MLRALPGSILEKGEDVQRPQVQNLEALEPSDLIGHLLDPDREHRGRERVGVVRNSRGTFAGTQCESTAAVRGLKKPVNTINPQRENTI
jgi:hypothetical protein